MSALQRIWRRAHRRLGIPGLVAVALAVFGAAIAAWLPRLDQSLAKARLETALSANQLASQPPISRPSSTNLDPVTAYIDEFPSLQRNAADLTAIFAGAARHGIVLAKGEYQLKAEPGSPFVAYTATFPVHSQYGPTKAFAADVLRALPHAALDEIRISRESAGTEVLDSQVRFSLIYRSPR